MKKAIQKAIEGGFRAERGLTWEYVDKHYSKYEKESLLLRATFWQALGKAMVWKSYIRVEGYDGRNMEEWQFKWHRFIDHLAEGKDAESFFNELLK